MNTETDKYSRYREKNREHRREKSAEWWSENGAAYREANREKLRETQARWRARNRELARERGSAWREKNSDRQRSYEQSYRTRNREKKNESNAAYRAKDGNKEKIQQAHREWASKHKLKITVKAAKRRASKIQATPAWADITAIAGFYAEAKMMTETTGVQHHVDHIVPLRSKFVCGLHVETNLRVVPAKENLRKGNRTWPDQW